MMPLERLVSLFLVALPLTLLSRESTAVGVPQIAALTFQTGAPEFTQPGQIPPMDGSPYKKLSEQLANNPKVVPIRKIPSGLSKDARYGLNFSVGDTNRGYLLYLDWSGNGDFSDIKPRAFEKLGADKPEHCLFPACESGHIDPTRPMKGWGGRLGAA
jgi:hypothetical protein